MLTLFEVKSLSVYAMRDAGKEKGGKETTVLDRFTLSNLLEILKKPCCQSDQFGENI